LFLTWKKTMVDSVSLSPSTRLTLLERIEIARERDEASNRLATGQRATRISDDPQDFLRASALSARVNSLLDAKANIGQAISSLETAQIGLEAVEKLGEQLKGIAYAAQSATGAEKDALIAQFDVTRQQLDKLVGDVSYQGSNLISSPPDSQRVNLNDQPGSDLTVDGQASDVASLNVGSATADYNNFATIPDIETAIAAVDDALSAVRANASRIGNNAAILTTRETFTQDLANSLQDGADDLLKADINLEGARLLAANVRGDLGLAGQRITARSESLIVDLVRGGQ